MNIRPRILQNIWKNMIKWKVIINSKVQFDDYKKPTANWKQLEQQVSLAED